MKDNINLHGGGASPAVTAELLAVPPTNGIAEMIHIAVLDGSIGDAILFIHDQIRLGHRDTLVGAIGEELVGKIEML